MEYLNKEIERLEKKQNEMDSELKEIRKELKEIKSELSKLNTLAEMFKWFFGILITIIGVSGTVIIAIVSIFRLASQQ